MFSIFFIMKDSIKQIYIESVRLFFVFCFCFSYSLRVHCEKMYFYYGNKRIGGCYGTFGSPQSFYNETDEDRIWFLVTNNGEYIEMSKVSAFVSVDNDYRFSILDNNGSILVFGVENVKFEFNHRFMAINTPRINENSDKFCYVVNNEIVLIGTKGEVSIYNTSGLLMKKVISNRSETRINVSYLPAGVYIVQCGIFTFKFKKI